MSISVNTDGPVNTTSILPWMANRTFADLANAIADEVDDTSGEYQLQIQNAIFTAIRFCEREPFYFNENRDIVFDTVSGKAWYGGDDKSEIATIAGLEAVFCRSDGGQWRTLQPMPLQDMNGAAGEEEPLGRPVYYSYFGQRLRIYPAPDHGRYQIRLQALPARLAQIIAVGAAHPWFTQAFDLLRARAKYELYKDILKDPAMAMAAFNDFNEQMMAMCAETSRRNGAGRFRATDF